MASPNIANKQLISASNVTFERSGQALLKDINLSIASGMITVLLGHNGAGKTLLMQVMHGLLMPSSGTISSIGRTGQKMVFQKPVMLRRTAGQYFDFICPDCPAHIKQDWFHKAGLTGRTATPSRLLSGGEQQKLSLISVLATQPKLLFLDEPTAGVDVELRNDMWQIVEELKKEGVTIILTTHYIEEAEEVADRIAIINHGEISLVEEKQALMSRLGRKDLTLELQTPLQAIPKSLSKFDLTLSEDKQSLRYVYDTKSERIGVTSLLTALSEADIKFKDLQTHTSSLEEIFVSLVQKDDAS